MLKAQRPARVPTCHYLIVTTDYGLSFCSGYGECRFASERPISGLRESAQKFAILGAVLCSGGVVPTAQNTINLPSIHLMF